MPRTRTNPVALARRNQRGAALVIGLVLLLVLTLMAVAGMNTSTTELVMAGNEQFRRNASLASTGGVEEAIARLNTVPTVPGAAPTVLQDDLVAGGDDTYRVESQYIDEERGLPQSSADKFVGYHYSIDSVGLSARNARDRQVQGVLVVSGAQAGSGEVGQIGTGLP
jgi:type IV pilus assembly protein PilX